MDRDSSLGMVSSPPPGNPRFPIDIPIVPLFSTRDQRNLCTFYSRVMALPRLESLNFDGSNLDLDGRINDYNLFNTANQLYLPSWKIVSTKKSIWKKKRLNIFVKLAYSFFIAFPLSNFLFILTIRVLYIFINNSPLLCRKFLKHRTDSKSRKDWRKKGEKRFGVSLVNGGTVS